MRTSASCEYGSFHWYVAQCREGLCVRAAPEKIRGKLLLRCFVETAHDRTQAEELCVEKVTHKLLNTCLRQAT